MDAQECIYCGESVERADDGAWQGVEDGACGCTASLEQGGDGEHDGEGGGACVECGAPIAFHWTGSCPDREVA